MFVEWVPGRADFTPANILTWFVTFGKPGLSCSTFCWKESNELLTCSGERSSCSIRVLLPSMADVLLSVAASSSRVSPSHSPGSWARARSLSTTEGVSIGLTFLTITLKWSRLFQAPGLEHCHSVT